MVLTFLCVILYLSLTGCKLRSTLKDKAVNERRQAGCSIMLESLVWAFSSLEKRNKVFCASFFYLFDYCVVWFKEFVATCAKTDVSQTLNWIAVFLTNPYFNRNRMLANCFHRPNTPSFIFKHILQVTLVHDVVVSAGTIPHKPLESFWCMAGVT